MTENKGSSVIEHDEITEVTLLLPMQQVEALEQVANSQGVTIGQLLRRLVHNTICQHATTLQQQHSDDE